MICALVFTVKFCDGDLTPAIVTQAGPVSVPGGRMAVICESLQEVIVARLPLNWTVLLYCAEPKLLPEMTTLPFTGPVDGVKAAMAGAPSTVKGDALLVALNLVTVKDPLVAVEGKVAVMLVSLQVDTLSCTPFKEIEPT